MLPPSAIRLGGNARSPGSERLDRSRHWTRLCKTLPDRRMSLSPALMNSLWTLVRVIATLEMPGLYDTPIIDPNNVATTATSDTLSNILPLWPTGRKRGSDSFCIEPARAALGCLYLRVCTSCGSFYASSGGRMTAAWFVMPLALAPVASDRSPIRISQGRRNAARAATRCELHRLSVHFIRDVRQRASDEARLGSMATVAAATISSRPSFAKLQPLPA
jgi:hypothetical protein